MVAKYPSCMPFLLLACKLYLHGYVFICGNIGGYRWRILLVTVIIQKTYIHSI